MVMHFEMLEAAQRPPCLLFDTIQQMDFSFLLVALSGQIFKIYTDLRQFVYFIQS